MNRLSLLLVFALCLPLAARADDASHRAKAQELVAVIHTQDMVKQLKENIMKQISELAARQIGPNPTPENSAKAADFEKNVSEVVDTQVGWRVMEPLFIDIYAKTFTDDELDAITAFYKSPAGIAFLDKTPVISAQVAQLMQARKSALQPLLNQPLTDFRKSLVAIPPPASPAPPAAAAPTLGAPK